MLCKAKKKRRNMYDFFRNKILNRFIIVKDGIEISNREFNFKEEINGM